MNRPEVICHMVSTIDGKIVGQSFAEEGLRPYLEFYVQTKQNFGQPSVLLAKHLPALRQ